MKIISRSMNDFLNELDTKRIKSMSVSADTPRIGIFWLHAKDGKVKIFHSIVETIELGQDYGNFIISAKDHHSIWESLKPHGIVPKSSNYEDLPRGRVAYDKDSKEYVVYYGNWISSMSGIKTVIKSEFKLKSSTRWESDSHYVGFKRWGF